MPLISVVMPTYNTSVSFLKEAVESIINQTFQDFEFIIIDDGSINDTPEYLRSLTDSRVRVIRNNENIGITKSLNIGFNKARGKYIARMDSDDISKLNRFEKQYLLMENNPDVIVCGSRAAYKKGFSSVYDESLFPKIVEDDMEIYRIRMLFSNPGPTHSTAFFRRDELVRHHIKYDERLVYAQDYGMWMKVSQYGRICILQEPLLYFRHHENQISEIHREEQIRCDKITQKKLLLQLVDSLTEKELDIHYRYSTRYYHDVIMTDEVKDWYLKLIKANKRKGIYNKSKFNRYVYQIMYHNINLTWNNDMTKYEKLRILFRYMPWFEAVKMLIAIGKTKLGTFIEVN